jgi:hypothetical protein
MKSLVKPFEFERIIQHGTVKQRKGVKGVKINECFAVANLGDNAENDESDWRCFHLPTGFAAHAGSFDTSRKAKLVANLLPLFGGWNYKDSQDIPGSQMIKGAKMSNMLCKKVPEEAVIVFALANKENPK